VYRFGELDEARPADAAVVLGAAVFRERPSPVLRERINHAILLYEQGYVETIIFTGGLGDRDSLTEAEVARQYALARGVPDEAILMETTSTNTAENLANTKSLAEAQGVHSFLIVSTPVHMKRALAMADALEMEAYTSPTRTIQWISWATKTRAFVREVGAYAVYLVSWQG
jgi:uncharacterized SAM-binding protein YcdF (DUF218 family)